MSSYFSKQAAFIPIFWHNRCDQLYQTWLSNMERKFYIELNMKTADGFERFGCFELGSDRGFAIGLFGGLAGRPAEDDSEVLHMDLVEKRGGLPMNMQVVSCTVEELGKNIKYLTRELFKKINLGDTLL